MTGSRAVEVFLEYLKAEGARAVFGVPGGLLHPFFAAVAPVLRSTRSSQHPFFAGQSIGWHPFFPPARSSRPFFPFFAGLTPRGGVRPAADRRCPRRYEQRLPSRRAEPGGGTRFSQDVRERAVRMAAHRAKK